MCDNLPAKLEFEISDLNQEKIKNLQAHLSNKSGVSDVKFDENLKRVYIKTTLPTSIVHDEIEKSTQSLAVLKGMGSGLTDSMQNIDSAVAELTSHDSKPFNVMGVIRFVQLDENYCAIDGTIDGLSQGDHALHIHEYGDLSDVFNKLGGHFNPHKKQHGLPSDSERHVGDLGNIAANEMGRSTFRKLDNQVKVWDIIGRSICVSEKPDLRYNDTGEKLACGIIARSSNIYQNVKRICLCSGKTLWEERQQTKDKAKI